MPDPLPNRDQLATPAPERPDTPGVRVNDAGAMKPAPCPLRDSEARVTISRLRFSRAGGPDARLAPEIVRLLAAVRAPNAASLPLSAVCDLRDEANERLRRAGYIASVQIPPQTIETGELALEVVTARIVEVRVLGDAPPYRDTLAARVERLKALDPLNQRDAERILLIAGDIPGLDVQLALRPAGTAPGEVIGELTVAYRPYSLLFNINNLGSRQLGRETAYARAEFYGLTGAADVTYVGASATLDGREQQVLQVGHVMGLGSGGASVEASLLYAWSRPDVGALDLRSRSLIAGLTLAQPVLRSRRAALDVAVGTELIEQRTRVFIEGAGAPLNRDKLRVGFVRASAAFRDFSASGGEAYSLGAVLEVRKGFDVLGATQRGEVSASGFTPSRFAGDPEALVVRGGLDAVVPIAGGFSLAGRAHGQWANHPLLNFEEFSVGNLSIGRGYDPGATSADRAVGLRAEARMRVLDGRVRQAEAFGFYDSVSIRNLDPGATEDKRRLASYGGGLRMFLRGIGAIEATYARPLDPALSTPDARRAPARLLLSLSLQFPPGGR